MRKIILGLTTMALLTQPVLAQQASVEDRLSELEANASLNVWSFRGTLVTRYDSLSGEQETDSKVISDALKAGLNGASAGAGDLYAGALNQDAFEKQSTSHLRLRYSFDADASVSPTFKFYSRLTASKFMNKFASQGSSSDGLTDDLTSADAGNGSQIVLEKAYADLLLQNTNFIISAGRLPTVDGAPTHFWDGRARLGTYPMMSYNAVLDGFAVTYKADEFLGGTNKLAARIVYTPFSNINFGSPLGGTGILTPYSDGNSNKMPNQTDLTALQLDYSTGQTSFAENVSVIVQQLKSSKINFNTGASPLADAGTSNPTDLTLELGSTTVAVEVNNLMDSGFDLSLTHFMSQVKTQGTLHVYIQGSGYQKMGGYGCFSTTLSTLGQGCEETYNGNISVASLSYKLPISARIGAEYVKGGKENFYFDGAGENLTDFYSTPGTATHLYWTQMLSSNTTFRFGVMNQNYEYTTLGYGRAAIESDRKIMTSYANLRMDF